MINITSHSLEAPPHEIPIWALRLEVQGIINRYAEVFECSRDFITAAVYAIVSTICGKHIELFDGKYNNNPNHWICVVAPSGSNKSAPIKALLEPIFKEEKLRIKKFKEEYREYKKKGGEEPVRDRLIVSDVTPEGLYQVLADKDNTKAGLLLYRDEIKGFLDDMNRYNSSGEISNYLSIYDGTPFPVDRKTQEPQWISNPFLCILGGIQPRAIANAFKPSWADEGFVQRWLYVYPQVLPEKEYKDNVLDEMYKTAWYEMTDKLSAIGDMKLLLSTEAKVLLTEFNKETAKKERDADPWVASILSKIRIQIEKWCAITHILSCGETLKQDLSVLPQIAYCALSVSGKGLFLVIPLRYPEKHLQQFRQLQIDFRKMGIMIDSACSDITRLRCLSYDEHPIINENATLYEGVYVEKPKHKSFPTCFIYEGENTSAEVAVCCRKIQQCGIDITASYDDWLKVGCALATLGESGRSLFHICSQQNAKYNAAKTDKMFTDLLRRNYQQVNIGTFFWMCKQHGITTKE